jgi:hypothetical protein
MDRTLVIVSGRHRPHEVLLLAWSLIFGVSGLASAPAPGSIVAMVPPWEVGAWSAMLAGSGAVGLVGISLRRSQAGTWLELAGMLFGSAATLMYCVAVVVAAGSRGMFAAGLVAAWTLANLWRACQLCRELGEW